MEQFNNPDVQGTGTTAAMLGVSTKTLRRYRDVEGGFLIQDKDWFNGAYDNSPIRWDVEKCRHALANRRKGFSKYQDFKLAKKILEEQQKK